MTMGTLLAWLIVTCIGIAAALMLGWEIGRGRKFDKAQREAIHAAGAHCPSCNRAVRGERGRFVKAETPTA